MSVSMFGSISLRRISNKNYKGHAKQRAYDEVKFERVVVNFIEKSGASVEKVGISLELLQLMQVSVCPVESTLSVKIRKGGRLNVLVCFSCHGITARKRLQPRIWMSFKTENYK